MLPRPEDRTLGIGAAAAFRADFTVPDQLAPDHPEVGFDQVGVGDRLALMPYRGRAHGQGLLRKIEDPRPDGQKL